MPAFVKEEYIKQIGQNLYYMVIENQQMFGDTVSYCHSGNNV